MAYKPTIFQRLQTAFGTEVSSRPTQKTYSLDGDNVIYRGRDRADAAAKRLELQQGAMLSRQWKHFKYDVNASTSTRYTSVQMMYRDADLMDLFPEIGAALDLVMEEVCYVPAGGQLINVYSESSRIRSVIEDLLYNRLSVNTIFPMITRSTCKYGNDFQLLNIDTNGVNGWAQMPVYDTYRLENGMLNPYMPQTFCPPNDDPRFAELSTKFLWVGATAGAYTMYYDWQVAHFRLLYDSLYLPFGVSFLNKARRHWRMLSMMEDMMLMYRLDRSMERRVYKVNVGNLNPNDVSSYIEGVANEFKRTPVVDPETGQIDLRKCVLTPTEDMFVPVRDPSEPNPVETLSGGQNLTAIDDIEYVQKKICAALRVPKEFINFDDAKGEGKNLAILDIRFARTIARIQQMMLAELNKICIIHLYLMGFEDELDNFSLSMNNPSTQMEMMETENLSKKIATFRDCVSDPGSGIPIMSMDTAWHDILGWSDDKVKKNYEAMRYEKAAIGELENTGAKITHTGLFDKVDRIYGNIEGIDTPAGGAQGGEEGGGDAMPMEGGGGNFGGFSDMGDIGGMEGDMELSDVAEEGMEQEPENEEPTEDNSAPTIPLSEDRKRTTDAKPETLNEQLEAITKRMGEYTVAKLSTDTDNNN